MAKRQTQFVPNGYYHIYNRGASRQEIFHEDENYLFLLRRIGRLSDEYSIAIIAYCLMPNHYHFLLRQDENHSITDFVQGVFNSYSKAFNRKYGRSGTLFEGPFRSIHVDKEEYLIYLCRYIHCNPLKARLVANIQDWPYSNYLDWIGKRNGKLFDADFVQSYFPTPAEYQDFVLGQEHDPGLGNYLFQQSRNV